MKKQMLKRLTSLLMCTTVLLFSVSCSNESTVTQDSDVVNSITSDSNIDSNTHTQNTNEDSEITNSEHFDGDTLETLNIEITVIDTTSTEESTTETTTNTTCETTSSTKSTKISTTAKKTDVSITSDSNTTETTTNDLKVEDRILYKPRTHYFHKQTCRWCDSSCTEDYDLNTVYGRICSECNPQIELIHVYQAPDVEIVEPDTNRSLPVTQREFTMLANLVAHEYGANWVPTDEKAKVVMTVMNRVRSSKYPNNVKDVILQKNQYCWVPDSYYWKRTTQDCKNAVIYYFQHQNQYSTNLYSFWGDGKKNHFY